jgi:hypothetical protein
MPYRHDITREESDGVGPVPSTEAVEALHGGAEPFGPLEAPATFTSDCSLIRALTEPVDAYWAQITYVVNNLR